MVIETKQLGNLEVAQHHLIYHPIPRAETRIGPQIKTLIEGEGVKVKNLLAVHAYHHPKMFI
jgi:hypothetical protein